MAPKKDPEVAGDAPSRVNPELRAIALHHIAICSKIECLWEELLIWAVYENAELVHELLASVNSPGARQQVFRAAFKRRIPQEDIDLIFDTWKYLIGPSQRMRDKYAHYLWAIPPDNDSVLLVDPKAHARAWAQHLKSDDAKYVPAQGVRLTRAEMIAHRDRAEVASEHAFRAWQLVSAPGSEFATRQAEKARAELRQALQPPPTPLPLFWKGIPQPRPR